VDRTVTRRVNVFILRHRLLIFLVALLTLLIVFPFLAERYAGYHAVVELFFSFLLIIGIYTVSSNRDILTVAVLLALLTITLIWFNTALQTRGLLLASLLLEITFFVLTTVVILSHVLQYKKVTADKIYGAICGYLLIGIIWALIYTALENYIPGSFNFHYGLEASLVGTYSHPLYFAQFIYYSFVTLTTLGYGDITPLSYPARAFSSLEAVIGQLYVAVLISRLVGLHIIHADWFGRHRSSKD